MFGLVRRGSRTCSCGRRRPAPARRHARDVPAALPCLNTSPQRSTPGPLPYHMAKTPSYCAPGNRPTCWLPQTAVARQVLVDARLEVDMVASSRNFLRLPQRLIEPAERRAAIAGDEAGRIQPGRDVALPLHHRQPHQRLGAGQKHPPAFERVLVVKFDSRQRHLPVPPETERSLESSSCFSWEKGNPY